MSVDLSQVQFASPYNSFKNDNVLYTGSVNFPTSLTAGQTYVNATTISLSEAPQFSKFYAYFQEYLDATVGNPAYWYPANVGGQYSVGVYVNDPLAEQSWLNGFIYPVIFSGEALVTVSVFNPYPVTVTLTALNVPYAFVTYSLAE